MTATSSSGCAIAWRAVDSHTGLAPGASTARSCSVSEFGAFNGQGVIYRDGVAHWPNTEPAEDYTALTLLAFAQAANLP